MHKSEHKPTDLDVYYFIVFLIIINFFFILHNFYLNVLSILLCYMYACTQSS